MIEMLFLCCKRLPAGEQKLYFIRISSWHSHCFDYIGLGISFSFRFFFSRDTHFNHKTNTEKYVLSKFYNLFIEHIVGPGWLYKGVAIILIGFCGHVNVAKCSQSHAVALIDAVIIIIAFTSQKKDPLNLHDIRKYLNANKRELKSTQALCSNKKYNFRKSIGGQAYTEVSKFCFLNVRKNYLVNMWYMWLVIHCFCVKNYTVWTYTSATATTLSSLGLHGVKKLPVANISAMPAINADLISTFIYLLALDDQPPHFGKHENTTCAAYKYDPCPTFVFFCYYDMAYTIPIHTNSEPPLMRLWCARDVTKTFRFIIKFSWPRPCICSKPPRQPWVLSWSPTHFHLATLTYICILICICINVHGNSPRAAHESIMLCDRVGLLLLFFIQRL